jgi:hypothetical protein
MLCPAPHDLPFLRAICWQTEDIEHFTPLEMLQRYERGWHYRGVLADLGEMEQAYLKFLCQEYRSWLLAELPMTEPSHV